MLADHRKQPISAVAALAIDKAAFAIEGGTRRGGASCTPWRPSSAGPGIGFRRLASKAGAPAIRSTAGTRLCRGVRTGTARTRTGSWNAWSSPSMMACSTARLERAMVCLLIEVKRPSMLQCGVLLTQTGQSPDQNPALQQAPDLMPANPLCCQLGKGQ